ncbi:hypothetical protein GGTG_09769 [Gaeumannomyces tritici R3-111a-1]|uniref:Uncharacterized protein n=1 Tax=Gaeumannomyces tritici (strain R3-111a-1) TaxID=644352 RepID=J3P8D5_GAET3|nr:hypothetical protein GGTG_09769 [Gaeumannomyces tritici R3-111a-1]EJT72918.1 hypothetical protein GGTG_09769 [Gaeumannomyces tritici R3-111a-1]
MQALVLTLGVFAAIPTVLANTNAKATACNANNCARDVTGTREGKLPLLEVRKTDCANFITATVYATPTATPQNVVYNRKMKRDPVTVKGQTVPSYIKQCNANMASYASACSCWGYTSTTITVTTPTTPGVQWAYYALEEGSGSGKVPAYAHWGNFSPDNIKGLTPFSTGWGKRLSIGRGQEECVNTPAYVNGEAQTAGSHHTYAVLQARGYILADRDATYHVYFNRANEMLQG